MGDHVLHLSGVLGGAVDQHVAALPGQGEGDVALEIELVLTADAEAALQPVGSLADGPARVAVSHVVGRQHEGLAAHRRVDVEHRLELFVVDLRQLRRAPGMLDRRGCHRKDRMADVLHQPIGEDGVVTVEGSMPYRVAP